MSVSLFNSIDSKYNRIPLIRKTLADLDTPVSAYLKLANIPYTYLFESVQGGEKWGRYSIIGLSAETVIKIYGNTVKIFNNQLLVETIIVKNPLDWIEQYQQQFIVAPISETLKINPQVANVELFTGGLVGFFSYDTIAMIEPQLANDKNSHSAKNPDILLMLSEEILVFDSLNGCVYAIILANPNEKNAYKIAQNRLDEISNALKKPILAQQEKPAVTLSESDLIYDFNETEFKAGVRKIKDYIIKGDVMQVVLAQQMRLPFIHSPIDLYRALRSLNPSPYMFYLHLDGIQIVGSSPEILVRLEQNKITVRPIAGTRKRGADETEDLALEQELLADPKELAEHLMLIDLGRNDAGRVSQTGSVTMTEKMTIERYSHVMHIVSNVEGDLAAKTSPVDVLKATFPAGTVSGAPKIRAMEIINELEPNRRGIYGGAVGYLGWFDNLDTAIAIRTAVVADNQVFIQAGAGIVYDSNPDLEWEETMNKARALINATIMASANFGER